MVDEALSNDSDQLFMNTDFGMVAEKELEWIALRKITIGYIMCLTSWFACLIVEEPECGIPMRSWTVYYLFFRMFRNVHNGIGIMLHLNDTPFYYKPTARLIIFWTFEIFELLWMLYGEYLFYFSSANKCNKGRW